MVTARIYLQLQLYTGLDWPVGVTVLLPRLVARWSRTFFVEFFLFFVRARWLRRYVATRNERLLCPLSLFTLRHALYFESTITPKGSLVYDKDMTAARRYEAVLLLGLPLNGLSYVVHSITRFSFEMWLT